MRITPDRITQKPWGSETLLEVNPSYALKKIYLKKGTRSSLQSHIKKVETIVVTKGSLELETQPENTKKKEVYSAGEAYNIPAGLIHRVEALEDCELIEVSTPELDDVVRHADDYGRA